MKKSIFLVALVAAFNFLTSCGPTPDDAVKYNDGIIAEMDPVISAENDLLDALEKTPDEMKSAYSKMLEQINKSTEAVKNMAKFDGKTELADAALKYFGIYKSVLETEYKQMIEILSKPIDQNTEADDAAYSKALEDADKKLNDASKEFDEFQTTFSTKYNFTINRK